MSWDMETPAKIEAGRGVHAGIIAPFRLPIRRDESDDDPARAAAVDAILAKIRARRNPEVRLAA